MSLIITRQEKIEIELRKCRVCNDAPKTSHAHMGFYPIDQCCISCNSCGITVSSKSDEPGYYGITELTHYREAAGKWNRLMSD